MSSHFQFDIGGAQPIAVNRPDRAALWRMLSNPPRLTERYASCALLLPRPVIMALRQRGTAEASGN